MNSYQIKAMEESAEFLYSNKMSRNFLWELLEASFKAKEYLRDILHLKEENDYRAEIPIPKEEGNVFNSFANEICKIKSKEDKEEGGSGAEWTVIDKMFIQDSKKNKYKITRLLNAQLWKLLIQTKVGLELAVSSQKLACCEKCTFENTDNTKAFIREFALWYGEQTKGNCKIILSAHPMDILGASVNSSFTSCYAPTGSFFNGTISSMLSEHTLVATLEENGRPGYKVGRSWVYANDDIIICARKYGGITDEHHLHIRNYIYTKMGGEWKHKPTLKISNVLIDLQGPGYLDNGHGDVMINKRVPTSLVGIKKIIIPKAICLFCGVRHNTSTAKGICKSCMNTVSPEEMIE